ncbi:peptide ABC transporter substrate-binding protein [Macrococcus hajekii]|uniref:Peptide ABC transporter substrate-binding protein n=1 Tax=Macrococcus hajekii TaxID=198482 RepID=A0A4R6BJF0_9STAP|nr:peptide ABC transporter substrate-binding protein [Macrococcus hajekii]TDM01777.1 peptide ABC transporter substrate-binding protein [Macrococcus hajekii]GGB07344.1 peptide ABC transporter substrate-binding protein [Macrococcus hajekii]
MKKILVLLTALLVILAGCGDKKSEQTGQKDQTASKKPAKEQVLNLNLGGEPYTLDPAFASDTTSWWVIDSIYSGLYKKGKNGEPELEAAEKVDVSPDKKTYTFTLKDGLKWSNGDNLTAKDFEYGWKRVLDPKTAAYSPSALYFIEGAEAYNTKKGKLEDVGIHAKDDKTLVVKLKNPISFFPKVITGAPYYPVNKKAVEKGKNWAASADTLVSNGPFKLKNWKHNDSLAITKNDQYFDKDKIKLSDVNFRMVADTNTEYQLYQSGDLDLLVSVPADILKNVKDSKELVSYDNFSVGTYSFNVNEKPVDNKKIRQALSYAIDRQSFVTNVLKGGQKPAYGYVSYGVKDSEGKDFRDDGKKYYEYDPAKAKQLLAEGLKEEGLSQLPKLTLKTNGEGINKKSAEVIQEMLKKNLGIDVSIETQEWKTYIDTFKQKNFQLARMGWNGDFLDPYPVLALYASNSSSNFTNWKNKKYDQLLEQSLKEKDDTKRLELLHQAEDILMDELPILPVNFGYSNSLIKENVKGVKTDALSRPNFIYAEKQE